MNESLRRASLWAVALYAGILLLPAAPAQQAAESSVPVAPVQPSPAEEKARMEKYVRVLQAELGRAEARVGAVTEQLLGLDDDIESRVGRIVSLLSTVRDSTDTSSVRIRKEKEEVLEALKATAVYYAQERDKRKKEMGNPYSAIESDELARNVATLNERIEVRVTQSLAIASSLTQFQESPVDRHWNTDINYALETREARKGERDATESAKIKGDLADDLEASIDKLSRDVKAREAELQATRDPEKQARLKDDIQTMRQTVDARRKQLEALVTAPRPATKPVSSKGAFELDEMVDEMAVELKKDFAKFKILVKERDEACARVKPLKARLEKAVAQLDKAGGAPVPGASGRAAPETTTE